MKLRCLIPDTMIIIRLHELDLWNLLCRSVSIVVPSILVHQEVQYYVDSLTEERVAIDLKTLVADGVVSEQEATVSEMQSFLSPYSRVGTI